MGGAERAPPDRAGRDKSAVARTTGHDRKTIGRYVATVVELGWRPGTDEPTEALAAAVAARHSPARDFFGGVPWRVVLDNLKAAVTKADRYDPVFERTFEEYAAYRGFTIDPAPPRMPTGRPFVERQVPYVRESFFRGEDWRHRDHVQEQAPLWCLKTAGMRVHGTTRKRP